MPVRRRKTTNNQKPQNILHSSRKSNIDNVTVHSEIMPADKQVEQSDLKPNVVISPTDQLIPRIDKQQRDEADRAENSENSHPSKTKEISLLNLSASTVDDSKPQGMLDDGLLAVQKFFTDEYHPLKEKHRRIVKGGGNSLNFFTKLLPFIPEPTLLLKYVAKCERGTTTTTTTGADCIAKVSRRLEVNCAQWLNWLRHDFNVLAYGVGSKKDLLEAFCEQCLHAENYATVYGFSQSVSLKAVLLAISQVVFQELKGAADLDGLLLRLIEHFNRRDSVDFYLVVHNIDGSLLRTEAAQTSFSRLASARRFHLLASIDTINCPILWSHRQLSDFNWVWQDCSTFRRYIDETWAIERCVLFVHCLPGTANLLSLRHVMESLNKNAREIYIMLARYEAGNRSSPGYQGMPTEELYWRCRDAFLVANDSALRHQLTEFKDHQLLKIRKLTDGSDALTIPLDIESLNDFLEDPHFH